MSGSADPSRSFPFDAIVVLGAAVRPDGRPSGALARRVERGVELFQAGEAGALLLTGGGSPSEASVMRALAVEAGVPEACIVVEEDSVSTLENAIYSASVMAERGWVSALLVSDPFHLPRGLLAFRSVGVSVRGRRVRGLWRGPFRSWWRFLAYESCAFPWYVVQILAGRHRR